MSDPARRRQCSPATALGIAAALLGLETLCAILFYADRLMLPLLLHGLTCVAANVLAWRRYFQSNALVATLRMSAMLLPFLGPVALFAAVALLAAQLTRRSIQPDAATWHEHLFPNLAADPFNDRMDEIARRQPSATVADVESFYDVLRWGTLQEREHILFLISRSFRAEFAPVLREALASDDLGLRAQAAAGLSLLETRTSTQVSALQQSHRAAGTEPARARTAIALAHALGDAAHSGLYDELRTIEMRREIVSLLAPLFDARPGDPALGVVLGRTMIHLGEFDTAVATLAQTVESGAQTDVALGWLMEGLFRRGDFAAIAALVGRHREQSAALADGEGPLAPALSFWGVAT